MSLHLLRPFTGWRSGTSLRAAEAYVNTIRGGGYDKFYTTTARCPRRAAELEGGSVYFVRSGYTVFRMPFVEIEHQDGEYHIAMKPRLIRVEPLKVGFVRGWRYLERDRAPEDLDASVPADLADAGDRAFDRIMAGGRA